MPYYWNIAPEYDATITPVYMTKRGVAAEEPVPLPRPRSTPASCRLEYLPDDKEFGDVARAACRCSTRITFAPGPDRRSVDYNRVSDDRYFVDLASQVQAGVDRQPAAGRLPHLHRQPRRRARTARRRACSASRRCRIRSRRSCRRTTACRSSRSARSYNDLGGLLDTHAAGRVRALRAPDAGRGHAHARSTRRSPRRCVAPGWFLTPKVGLRYVELQPDAHRARAAARRRSVIDPLVQPRHRPGVRARGRAASAQALTQTLEPRLFYVYVPYRNQDAIPIFDTALADFNYRAALHREPLRRRRPLRRREPG